MSGEHRTASSSTDRDDNPSSGTGRRRKQRQTLSCAECRRLKLRCDRTVPCTNCVRRTCADLCPDGARLPAKGNSEDTSELKARLEALENLLTGNGIVEVQPMPTGASDAHGGSVDDHNRKRVRLNPTPTTHAPVASLDSDPPAVVLPPLEPDQALIFDFDLPPALPIPEPTLPRASAAWNDPPLSNTISSADNVPQEQSYGTLVMSKSGGSKYYGHTAASEWLKDQELQDPAEGISPRPSRLPTPERYSEGPALPTATRIGQFPFQVSAAGSSTAHLLSCLPSAYEARVLVDSYYRYFAWHFDVAPRDTLTHIMTGAYAAKEGQGQISHQFDNHQLSLLFIVLAMGALHSLELPQNDPSAEEYLDLAKRSLAKSDFLTHSTVAAIQTLHIMAHYHLETEKGRNGDQAWPLWGIAMRLLQAMGLHRDGSRWNLPAQVVEERRRVFWECYSADIFQANCFSRPNAIAPQHFDTAYPEQRAGDSTGSGPRHDLLKFELSKISASVLDLAMRVDAPHYSSVTELHNKLVRFERNIPYELRCRDVLLALPSMYFDADTAIRESPEVTRKDLTKTLQQYTLSLNVTESMLFLHRPYFAKALHERKPDPTQTVYGQSYLCVIERCNVMIQICAGIYPLHPAVIARHWYFWYHVFNAAVCMGTLILQSPRNMLASFALSLIDSAIRLYTSIIQTNPTTRLLKNLEWLLRLRQRASNRIVSAANDPDHDGGRSEDEEDNSELIGWRTRLVERLGKGSHKVTTITPTQSTTTPSPNTAMMQTITQALQEHFVPQNATRDTLRQDDAAKPEDPATDALLHQFWDPMMMQEQLGEPSAAADWWNWEPTAE